MKEELNGDSVIQKFNDELMRDKSKQKEREKLYFENINKNFNYLVKLY